MNQKILDNLTQDNTSIDLPREKVALLEITPRQMKLIFAWQIPGRCFEVFDEFVEPLKIYEDIDRDGFIKPTQIAESVDIVKMFRKLCDNLGVQKAVAYATTSFREAKNHYGFLEELEIASGFKIKLLQEQDEIVSVYNGVINTLDYPRGVIMYIDDEYTMLIRYTKKTIVDAINIEFGAESLATLFLDSITDPNQQMKEMEDFFYQQLQEKVEWNQELAEEERVFIGGGEVFQSIGKISRRGKKYPLDIAHNYEMNQVDFDNVYNTIKSLDLSKRTKIKGISTRSSSTIASGLAIVNAILKFFGAENYTISETTISTGILFNQCVTNAADKPLSDIILYSLRTNLAFHETYAKNHYHIYELAVILFRQLRVLHKLSRSFIRPLKIACFMYDSSSKLHYSTSKKDALYMTLHTQLYGATHREQVLAAFIAGSQNIEEFSLSEWVKYKDLVTEEDLDAVRKLAVILKISVALDRSQQGFVEELICDVLGDSVIMKTITPNSEAKLELRDASEAVNDFKKAYGKSLELL